MEIQKEDPRTEKYFSIACGLIEILLPPKGVISVAVRIGTESVARVDPSLPSWCEHRIAAQRALAFVSELAGRTTMLVEHDRCVWHGERMRVDHEDPDRIGDVVVVVCLPHHDPLGKSIRRKIRRAVRRVWGLKR